MWRKRFAMVSGPGGTLLKRQTAHDVHRIKNVKSASHLIECRPVQKILELFIVLPSDILLAKNGEVLVVWIKEQHSVRESCRRDLLWSRPVSFISSLDIRDTNLIVPYPARHEQPLEMQLVAPLLVLHTENFRSRSIGGCTERDAGGEVIGVVLRTDPRIGFGVPQDLEFTKEVVVPEFECSGGGEGRQEGKEEGDAQNEGEE